MIYVDPEKAMREHPIRAKITDIITYPVESIRFRMASRKPKDPTADWEEARATGWRDWQKVSQHTWMIWLKPGMEEWTTELSESSSIWGQVFLMTNPIFIGCLVAFGLIITIPPLRDFVGALLAPFWNGFLALID